jgi:lysine-ketoglutarate reductase/saccharopine dehydrogenase-like protein (TIGR00300 family)
MAKRIKVRAEGHLIDSGSLRRIMDLIVLAGARYEFGEFRIGRTNDDPSVALIEIEAGDGKQLEDLLGRLLPLGAAVVDAGTVRLEPAPADGVVPDDFYSTTNHATEIRLDRDWIKVEQQRMDSVLVVDSGRVRCVKLREVRAGQAIVVGMAGVRVRPAEQERDRAHFGFMNSEISSEKRVEHVVERLVQDIAATRKAGRKVIVVAGPVVVHTGGVEPMEQLVAAGAFDALLSGNALAVHDIERALFNTSLGVDAESGEGVQDGHRNHMRAINTVRRAGDIPGCVGQGILTRGIMHGCVVHRVPFVLAGSLRDDGPLPEVITDMNEAQQAYSQILQDAGVVLILSTMLHGIAVGNMIPSSVLTVCVDINPAVVTKLADRGSAQTVAVVTDVGLFLALLARRYATAKESEES